ncbi:MAG TPA: ABC transporter permease subunit [Nevskiaceae bacterium]|nr:ABC transporter permease subunit [Nevskiaceae bacterium]
MRMALSVGFLAIILALVIAGPWLSPYAYDFIDFSADWGAPPSAAGHHWFGTDSLGRDIFVRTMQGGRISLLVGLAATLISLAIGVVWGAVAGYRGGRIDEVMMRSVDVLYALPFMFLVILLTVLFGRHVWLIFVAIGAVNWLDMARIVRGQALALKQRDFVAAARVAGRRSDEIVRLHIVPNLMGVVIVYAALIVPQAMLVESFLSFLGLGIQEPATSWGALVNDGAHEMESAPWSLVFPAGMLAITLLALNLLGDAMRDRFDPRLRG